MKDKADMFQYMPCSVVSVIAVICAFSGACAWGGCILICLQAFCSYWGLVPWHGRMPSHRRGWRGQN